MSEQSLDYAFLKYLGLTPEGEVQAHSFYLPYLAGYQRILDLGSGMGGFVKFLCDAGKDAYGVDSDPDCVQVARAIDAPIVEADVVDYLRTVEAESLDAIFSAHLVEHLDYQAVLEIVRLAHRALRPGGRLLLATPNHQALISHLDLYHLHFGHVAFYPAELLVFFMDYCGFVRTETGENAATAPRHIRPQSPWAHLPEDTASGALAPFDALSPSSLLPRPNNPLRLLIWTVKMKLLHWLVQPFTDQLAARDQALQRAVDRNSAALHQIRQIVDRPFESFAIGDKA